jgi:hypothetical protein
MVHRTFLKFTGAIALALPAIRARSDTPLTKRQEFNMEIKRSGSQPSGKGPAEWFYRHRAHRSAISSKRSGTRGRRQCHVRAGCSNDPLFQAKARV